MAGAPTLVQSASNTIELAAGAPPVLVQSASNYGTGVTDVTVTLDDAPTEGNLLVFVIGYRSNLVMTDAADHVEAEDRQAGWPYDIRATTYLVGAAEAAARTPATLSAAGYFVCAVHEITNPGSLNATTCIDVAASGDSGGAPVSTLASGTTGNTTVADSIAVAGVAIDATGSHTPSATNSYTIRETLSDTDSLFSADLTLAASGSPTSTTFSWTTAGDAAAVVAVIKGSVSASDRSPEVVLDWAPTEGNLLVFGLAYEFDKTVTTPADHTRIWDEQNGDPYDAACYIYLVGAAESATRTWTDAIDVAAGWSLVCHEVTNPDSLSAANAEGVSASNGSTTNSVTTLATGTTGATTVDNSYGFAFMHVDAESSSPSWTNTYISQEDNQEEGRTMFSADKVLSAEATQTSTIEYTTTGKCVGGIAVVKGRASPPTGGTITAMTPDLQFAFGDEWDDPPSSWTDCSAYLRSWSISSGKQAEHERYRASTATFIVDNTDRRFEPEYSAGAYYADVVPFVPVCFKVDVTADDTPDSDFFTAPFFGYVERWRCVYPIGDGDPICVVECAGAAKLLAQHTMSGGAIASDDSYTMWSDVLDDISWPWAPIKIGETPTALQAYTPATSENCWDVLNLISDSEGGETLVYPLCVAGVKRAYVAFSLRSGWARLHYINYQQSAFSFVFSDQGGSTDIPYSGVIELSSDDQTIVNYASVTRVGGAEKTITGTASVAAYGKRPSIQTGLLMETDDNAASMARMIVGRNKNPLLRVAALECMDHVGGKALVEDYHPLHFDVSGSGKWRPYGTFISVERSPGGGTTSTIYGIIEGTYQYQTAPGEPIHHRIFCSDYLSRGVWILDDPVYSVLGTSTILGY